MATISADEKAYVAGVSAATGIDPRVLIAWIASEGHPGDMYHNYMNITASTARSRGIPIVGQTIPYDNPTAEFSDVQTGIRAAVTEMNALGLGNLSGETPREQISAIAASPWASSHYGGPGGPNLVSAFSNLFGSSALTSPGQGSSGAAAIAVGAAPFPTKIGDARNALEGALKSPWEFVTSWRFAEVLGGALLLLVGVVLLARQFGVAVPGGGSVPSPGPIGEQPRRVQRRVGFEPQSAERDRREARARRGEPGSSQLARGDELPF